GRFGIDTIARDLRMAGWREANWTLGPITNPIVGVNGDPAAGGDTLTIRYEAARDCTFAVAPGGVAVNTYTVVSNEFRCNGQPIVAGIEQMQVYFGEDTDHDGVANRLVAPGSAGLDMTRVVSVRVHLLANTVADNVALGSQGYYFDDAVQPAVNDGHIRREYSVTVALRNPM
ncbi:MAG TPA: PilW family protein, partial [Gammaproteobacteria bacterium]|nr:PilW family protein [Gammaproteobacteria bacterium]